MCTREIGGETVEFGTTGYTMDHVFVLYDRDTGSVWYPMTPTTFDAVAGERRGESITFIEEPAPMPLGEWLVEHEDSEILLPTQEDAEMLAEMLNRPYMGVSLNEDDTGVIIGGVMEDTPAEQAGLVAGDVIRKVDDRIVETRQDLGAIMREHQPGDTIEVIVERDGAEIALELTLGTR